MEKNNFRKIATITLFESAVQWYCFLLYGTAAGTVFNKVFFSQTGNGTTALFLSYMSFAIGYIAGPFGAIFFGHIGDRKGRKVTMYASLLMMGISTSIIGILPPAASGKRRSRSSYRSSVNASGTMLWTWWNMGWRNLNGIRKCARE